MRGLNAILYRVHALLHRGTHEAEMAEELGQHLDGLISRHLAAGLSPADARTAALRAFGGVEQLKERCRDERRFRWLEEAGQDLRHTLRLLRKNPGFTTVAVLSLVIGIGANTAVFSLCNEVLLKALPVDQPQDLVLLRSGAASPAASSPGTNGDAGRPGAASGPFAGTTFSPVTFAHLRTSAADLAELFAFAPLPQLSVLIDGQPEVVPLTQLVSGNYYAGLQVRPALGRVLTARDDRPEAAPVAVISYRYWQRRFLRDPAAVGKVVWLNNAPVTIVGVTRPDFAGSLQIGESPDFSVPLAVAPRLGVDRASRGDPHSPALGSLRIMGRLAPGVTFDQLRVRMDERLREAGLDAFPEFRSQRTFPPLVVESGRQGLDEARQAYRPSLLILAGIAGIVLLIACVNVANLLLARTTARRREIAVRLALGASGGRIIRQLLTENLLLAFLGAGFGALLAWWGKDILLSLRPAGAGALILELPLDWRVLGLTTALTVIAGLVFGLAPAFYATQVELKSELRLAGAQGRAGGVAPAKALIVVQVALSLVLLVGAGLFTRTVRNLQSVDLGFNRTRLLLFQIDAVGAGRDRDQVGNLYRRLNERIAHLPGVQASTYSLQPLLGGKKMVAVGSPRNPPGEPGDRTLSIPVELNGVGSGFFSTFEIPMLAGRPFTAREETPGADAVIVNETLARIWFGNENALGQRTSWGEIVGVVRDATYGDLRPATAPTAYLPFGQAASPALAPEAKGNFAIRTTSDPLTLLPSIRRTLRGIDPKLPLFDVRTEEADVDRLLQQERLFARLSRLFGALALALVCVGLYGLMSYSVLRRKTEIGIRLALGALPRRVQRMILAEALGLVGAGLGLGLIIATVATPQIAALLYDLSPYDPLTFGGVAIALVAIGVLACWIPASRAARIHAMTALRCE